MDYQIPIYHNERIEPNDPALSNQLKNESLSLSQKAGTKDETNAFLEFFSKLYKQKFIVPLYNKEIFTPNNTILAFTDYDEYQIWDSLNGEVRAQYIVINYFELKSKMEDLNAFVEINYTVFKKNNMPVFTKFNCENFNNLENLYTSNNSKPVNYMTASCGLLPELYEVLSDIKYYFDHNCPHILVNQASLALATNLQDISDPDKIIVIDCSNTFDYLFIEKTLYNALKDKYGTSHPQNIKLAYHRSNLATMLSPYLQDLNQYIEKLKIVIR